tara:strand:+ start:556 stop:765 length:210 start_codon:yes stop_codon:yes gene_type:complete
MCLSAMPALQEAIGSQEKTSDEYKNPGSGSSTPQWKLGVNINNSPSTQESSGGGAPESTGEMTRSEVSG